MISRLLSLFPLLALAAAPARAGEFPLDGHTFRVPDGFTVEKVAGPGLVDRPIVADLDEKGRLYVADSSGSNEPPNVQLKNPTHRIVRLEDTDGDGKYDKSVVFADKMMFPEGAMWRDGSLYVAAPPSIWKLTDTDGDGVCDKREEWFQGKTLTGCANDLHGPYNGPDGWIYWAKGAFAEQTYTLPNGKPFKTRAAHIFRARPDGTGIEPVMTGGMDNPVEVAWSPSGDLFFTTTFLQHPGGGKRDGIIHAFYGGLWGKDHDVLDGHIRTSPELSPVMTHLGPAAPSGLMRYESSSFGDACKDNLFCAQFNMHKVSRHVLIPDGATFKTEDHDFLTVAEHQDFHPTDVLEDADGSILVLDTGGWYKLCCPTSQIGKPDVLGAIYRVRKVGAPKVDDPLGSRLEWAKLGPKDLPPLLGDRRPFVRRRAVAALGAMGAEAVGPLSDQIASADSPDTRRAALWAASRLPYEDALAVLNAALDRRGNELDVRRMALRVLIAKGRPPGGSSDRAIAIAREMLAFDDPVTIRDAAQVLALNATRESVLPLLAAVAPHEKDGVVQAALVRALIDLDAPDVVASLLELGGRRPGPEVRALLLATDQSGGKIATIRLEQALSGPDSEREAAEWVVERHPELADHFAPYYAARLSNEMLGDDQVAATGEQLARFARSPKIRETIGEFFTFREIRADVRATVLRAMARAGLKELPEEWVDGLVKSLQAEEPEVVRQAVATARAFPTIRHGKGRLSDALRAVADRAGTDDALRLDALGALPDGLGKLSDGAFGFLVRQLAPDRPVTTRLEAADVLAKADPSSGQLDVLSETLRGAGPLDVARLLPVFERSGKDEIGRKVAIALLASPALSSLRIDDLKPRFSKFGPEVQRQAEVLYEAIARANSDQRAKLDDLAKSISGGDIRRGQAIFNGAKAACSSCHAIGYLGGNVGPDLSRIGAIREERDLLESIVYPSASFVRSYEPMVVATKEGQVHSGVLRKDSTEEVVLATGPDKEVRIPRSDVEEMKPGTVSVMPAGLDQQLSRQDLADLIAFLKSRK